MATTGLQQPLITTRWGTPHHRVPDAAKLASGNASLAVP